MDFGLSIQPDRVEAAAPVFSVTVSIVEFDGRSDSDLVSSQLLDKTSIAYQSLNKQGELIQAYDAVIEGWSRALELRDKETEGHSSREGVFFMCP